MGIVCDQPGHMVSNVGRVFNYMTELLDIVIELTGAHAASRHHVLCAQRRPLGASKT
jgi:hypothetical protein